MNAAFDQSADKSKIQVLMETSQAERYAGINVSYENSFSAIKKDIFKETVDKKKQAALTKEVIPIEEKPNKPKDKFIVKNMNNGANANNTSINSSEPNNVTSNTNNSNPYGIINPTGAAATVGLAGSLNLTQEVKPSTSIKVDDMLNRTAAQYASSRSGKKGQTSSMSGDYKSNTQVLNNLGGNSFQIDNTYGSATAELMPASHKANKESFQN